MSEGVSHEHTTLFATSTSDSVEKAFISENRSAEVRISTVRKESDLFFSLPNTQDRFWHKSDNVLHVHFVNSMCIKYVQSFFSSGTINLTDLVSSDISECNMTLRLCVVKRCRKSVIYFSLRFADSSMRLPFLAVRYFLRHNM